jgi:hypothetical protein
MDDVYWASKKGSELAESAFDKVNRNFARTAADPYYTVVTKLYARYYGLGDEANSVDMSFIGPEGQQVKVYLNLFRFLVQQVVSLVAGSRLGYTAVPVNTDIQSKEASIVATHMLRNAVRQERMGRVLREATEYAVAFIEGFVRVWWDPNAGESVKDAAVDPATGEVVSSTTTKGANSVKAYSLLDVYRADFDPNTHDPNWIIFRDWVNRYDVIAQRPELREEIMNISNKPTNDFRLFQPFYSDDQDIIPQYTLYHKRSPSVPEGLEFVFWSATAYDPPSPLSYRKMPYARITPADVLRTQRGYSPAIDVMAIGDVLTSMVSTVISNQARYGLPLIQSKRGNGVDVRTITDGSALLEYNIEPIQGVDLPQSSPEAYQMIEMLRDWMIMLMGHNATSLGQIESSSRLSTASMSILEQKAMQAISGLQDTYLAAAEDVGELYIDSFRNHATEERTVRLVGRNNRSYVKAFAGSYFDGVDSIVVELGDLNGATPTQRLNKAQMLLQAGQITPAQFFEVERTGSLDTVIQTASDPQITMEEENELIAQGINPPVLFTDNHVEHILSVASLLASPSDRGNPQRMQAASQHVAEHLTQLRTMDPDLRAILLGAAMPPPPGGEQPVAAPEEPPPPAEPITE